MRPPRFAMHPVASSRNTSRTDASRKIRMVNGEWISTVTGVITTVEVTSGSRLEADLSMMRPPASGS